MERVDSPPPPLPTNTEPFTCSEPLPTQRKKKNKNNRRFSDEQIRSLESKFKMETKIEARQKLELARELGLQPRQVSIWFQNRRARWKSKQMEQEYRVLKANYDNLSSRFGSLKKENQSLLIQLQKLGALLKKRQDGGRESKDLEGNSTDSGSDNGDTNREFKENPSCLSEGLDHGVVTHSEDDERGNNGYLAKEEESKFLKFGEEADGSLVPPEQWCNFDSGGLFDHSCGTSNWWDFWT